ncbi:IS66 family insertion sequence element accessory protein TnpA [Blastopirellula marina]|uniref:IS66 family insertion sequence element accessory protein TnpA n=1 Tax=Blastopirellula marina TaxID=124 RepID=UPI00396563F0
MGWRSLIAEQASSRLSVRAFCLRRGVSEASFYARRRELARRKMSFARNFRRAMHRKIL